MANPDFTLEALVEKFPENKLFLEREIYRENVFQVTSKVGVESNTYCCSFDDAFKLLEHDELNEARASSKKAMWTAIVSIVLTLVISTLNYFGTSKVYVQNTDELLITPVTSDVNS